MTRKYVFDFNIETINNVMLIYSYVKENAKNMDASILLREQYIMILSAFDTYLHGVVEDHIVELIFNTANNKCFNKFDVSLDFIKKILNESDADNKKTLLRNHVKERLSKRSFQAPNNVEDAMNYLEIKHAWKKIGTIMNQSTEDVKDTLSLCVRRRNKIAHESDWNPVKMDYDDIEKSDVDYCRDFIVKIVSAIDRILTQNQSQSCPKN